MPDDWDEEDTSTTDFEALQVRVSQRIGRPCLTVLTGGASGQLFKVEASATIGRISGAEVRLDDDGISRKHACVRVDGERAWVEDLGSRNGTIVNGTRISGTQELRDGDKIQIGRATVLRFGFHDALDESFHETMVSSALRDGLTRLYNKRYLMERLDSELKFAHRHETALSLLLVDVDHFKKVNDTHGHLAGDAVLAHLAQVIGRAVRNEDVVARFGGEEIVVVLRATGLDPALHTGERLRKLVEASKVAFQGRELRATCSIGAAGFPSTPASKPEELVEAADQAMYRAKHAGRNRVSR
ncbi:MAG TPA: GGDEF domain-containing protein [Kofleriaceae bacterium]